MSATPSRSPRTVTPSTPPPLPPSAPLAAEEAARRRIPPRKLLLGFILACSVLCFFLILFVATVAILRESAPMGPGRAVPVLFVVKRIIAHHIFHFIHHHK
jgi:hypothetical protein